MSDEIDDMNNEELEGEESREVVAGEPVEESGSIRSIQHLSGMFEKWFLDYASYVP